jgi:hypothetical protein
MTTRKLLQESGTLTKSDKAGTYRVLLLSEGVGSSGVYPHEMFTQENADALASSLSFMNHPVNPYRPQDRPASDIVGRIGDTVTIEESNGIAGFWSEYIPAKSKPDDAAFIAEFADALGLSIFIGAKGHEDEMTGRFIVESLDGSDPYKSVDIVVAAGRGGRFDKALESFRALESYRSFEAAHLPPAEASAGTKKEGNMDEKKVAETLLAMLAPRFEAIEAFITESKTAADAKVAAEATATDVETVKKDAVKTALESVKLIDAAKDLLPSQRASLLEAAEAGKDVAPLIEAEAKRLAEFKTENAAAEAAAGRVVEGAGATSGDLTVSGWGN